MNPPCAYRALFGPVMSRRLGRSLGIDLTPGRQCCFDCLFCESGVTGTLTQERREWIPTTAVVAEFDAWIGTGAQADVITIAGAGEPTLHSGLGAVIDAVHARCAIPVVLLTNGVMLTDPIVRAEAARADVVKVSLSAWDDASLAALNRPVPGLTFDRLMEGLRAFRSGFAGCLWVETILVRAINDAPEQVDRIAARVGELRPDKIHLNTVVRPPAKRGTEAVSVRALKRLAMRFSPAAEVIGLPAPSTAVRPAVAVRADDVLAILARRPCTVTDLAATLDIDPGAVQRLLDRLPAAAGLLIEEQNGRRFYRAT